MEIDNKLYEYATEAQQRILREIAKSTTSKAAAAKLGLSPSRVRATLTEVRKQASIRGFAPEAGQTTSAVAEGYFVKRRQVYRDVAGEITRSTEVHERDLRDKFETVLTAVEAAAERFAGIAQPKRWDKVTKPSAADMLAVYPFGDPHLGLFAWARETGDANFNLDIAEAVMFGAVDRLVGLAPVTEEALIISVGDLFHADNLQNRTMRSGHPLDVDTRYPKVYQVAVSTITRCIDRALEKHARVRFISAVGNHDDVSAHTLAVAISAWYRNEPRVTVDLSPGKFHWHRFGKCLLGVTHGDTVKPITKLPLIMAHDRAEDWGQTLHRHWYTGHIHQKTIWEEGGVVVESLRTLTSRDAYAAGHGYRTGQDMKLDIWHKDRGLIMSHRVGVEDLAIDRD